MYTNWNELPRKKALELYALLLAAQNMRLDKEEDQYSVMIQAMMILRELTAEELKDWRRSRVEEFGEEDGETLFYTEMKELVEKETAFIMTDDDPPRVSPLTKNPYPVLVYDQKGKKKKLYGPADNLQNLSIAELADTFDAYEDFARTRDYEHLIRLLAIMWRPRKPKTKKNIAQKYQGDKRVPYVGYEATTEDRIELIKKLPPIVFSLLVHWFDSCRDDIINRYPTLFKSSGGGGDDLSHGWAGVLVSLSDGLVHLDKVAKQPYTNVLGYLSILEDRARAEEMKRALEKVGD